MAPLRADHADDELGRILRDAKTADVVVTSGSQPEAVVVSIDRYRELVREEKASLDRLAEHFDALVAGMQGPEAAEALARGFSATPEEMSAAALAATRRVRGG